MGNSRADIMRASGQRLSGTFSIDGSGNHAYSRKAEERGGSYLSKIFKKHLGATCIEYITQKRMEKAKELLVHTTMTQEEIAHAVGYTNVHYFSMLFKKQLGETPGQYRRQVRK